MKPEAIRWLLLPSAAIGLLVLLRRGASPGRIAFFALCCVGWYLLSRRKALSLDHRGVDKSPRR